MFLWLRSMGGVSSVDGSIKGPGPAGAPNITDGGRVYWTEHLADSGGAVFDYAVEDWPCVDFAGTHVATHRYRGGSSQLRQWRLVQLTKPNRLRALCVGIYPDGWSGSNDTTYFRFVARKPGWLRVRLDRAGYSGSQVDLQIGSIASSHKEPVLGRVLRHERVRIPQTGAKTVWLRTPAHPFAVTVVVKNKFSPHDVNPQSGDVRTLGAQTAFRWSSTKR
jgi:hypothetical protein